MPTMAMEKPELKTDLFKSQATAEELARIERVNIFKTKATDNKAGKAQGQGQGKARERKRKRLHGCLLGIG